MNPSKDYLLLFVNAPGGQYPLDRIRTMKGMFLLSQEASIGLANLYEFRAYDWGPFSTDVYRDLDVLLTDGLIATDQDIRHRYETYRVTSLGEQRATGLDIPDRVRQKIGELKALATSMSFLDLLEHVYERHPEYARRSKLRR
jgi:uncharacterized protein YwgA